MIPELWLPHRPKASHPLFERQTVKLARRRGAAEGRADRRRMKAAGVKFSRRHQADFAQDFRAGDGRFEDRPAAGADFFTHRQRRHPGAAAGVHDRFFQRIVVVQAVGQACRWRSPRWRRRL